MTFRYAHADEAINRLDRATALLASPCVHDLVWRELDLAKRALISAIGDVVDDLMRTTEEPQGQQLGGFFLGLCGEAEKPSDLLVTVLTQCVRLEHMVAELVEESVSPSP